MPEDLNINDEENKTFEELVASRLFGAKTFKELTYGEKIKVRAFLVDFYEVAADPEDLITRIDENLLGPNDFQFLEYLVSHPELITELAQTFIDSDPILEDLGGKVGTGNESIKEGASIQVALQKYIEYKAKKEAEKIAFNEEDYVETEIKKFGDFKSKLDHIDSHKRIRELLLDRPGEKFREDNTPAAIAPYQCRIGASTFLIPPTNIKVSQVFKTGSLTNGAIRQTNTPKTNLGHSETMIEMNLFFPNHESIWGFRGDKAEFDIFNWDPNPIIRTDITEIQGNIQRAGETVSDSVVDYFLSSLRGLVTQFRYAPFLPVKNEYLNRTYDITAVTMMGMSVTTVPDFPFVLQVTLQMGKFNFDPLLPMIEHFDQAIHWGRFRQYLGRAAARLDAKVNQGFLIDTKVGTPDTSTLEGIEEASNPTTIVGFEGELIPVFDKYKDIKDGRHFDLYYPVTTPSRIFAPDTTDFRQPGEDEQPSIDKWDGILSDLGLDIIEEAPQFNFFEYDRAIKSITLEREILKEWLEINKKVWQSMDKAAFDEFMDYALDKARKEGNSENLAALEAYYKSEWFYELFDLLSSNNKAFKDIIKNRRFKDSNYILNEWKVPMEKLAVDWDRCIVNGISVSLSNTMAKLQIQLQDEPVHQHLGGGDSMVMVSMTVLGEDNLIKFRRLFQHINGLARIEQAHGVLGFLGIKNVVTALCGIKYVLPLDFEVDTVPGMPHVYTVNMSFVDFDVMQQERETLSAEQQKEMIEYFGKRNPFLRIKQYWNAFNLYPDLPLDVRDETGKVVGHLDPDWYFRSFKTNDNDLFSWRTDPKVINLIRQYAELKYKITPREDGTTISESGIDLDMAKVQELEMKLRDIVANGGELPTGWIIGSDGIKTIEDDPKADLGTPDLRQILGVIPEQRVASFIDFYDSGYFTVGTINLDTKEETRSLRMSVFAEDLASGTLKNIPSIPNTTPYADYQSEYIDNEGNPNNQYRAMLQDFDYRNLRGRMLQAFPTYMLWLIDEGGRFAGIKLFDNFYGLNSVLDFSVIQSQDAIGDSLVLRVSNIYQKLTTPYNDVLITEDDPLYETPIGRWITTAQQRQRNIDSGLYNTIVDVNHIRLKPGVRVHLRAGYGANPNGLQTIFNGVITEVAQGDVMTIIAQSDAVELTGMVNSTNAKGHSGKIDGGLLTNFWLSEPRDLMVRLLSMGSSRFKEWVSWGSKGVIFSESRFGIRHFGNILYEEMTPNERIAGYNMNATLVNSVNQSTGAGSAAQFSGLVGSFAQDLSEISYSSFLTTNLNGTLINLGKMMWLNQASKRDYEIYKRNIYPGNGTGIAQFMGGDQLDAGIILTTQTAYYGDKNYDSNSSPTTSPEPPKEEAISPESNKVLVDEIYTDYWANAGVSKDELVTMLETPNELGEELLVSDGGDGARGLLEFLMLGPELTGEIINAADSGFEYLTENLLGSSIDFIPSSIKSPLTLVGGTLDVLDATFGMGKPSGIMNRIKNSGFGQLTGMVQEVEDDDLYGYQEVAFRAQTYMKTVWDLFEVCAALLPNYIVAVRPFEDRSTVFYGKPHWLYTSGVIPVSMGVSRDKSEKPAIEEPDVFMTSLLKEVQQGSSNDFEKMMRIVDDVDALKDISQFIVKESIDPYNAGGLSPDREIVNPVLQQSADLYNKKLADLELSDPDAYDKYKDWLSKSDLQTANQDIIERVFNEIANDKIDLEDDDVLKLIDENQVINTDNRGNTDAGEKYLNDLILSDYGGMQGMKNWEAQVTALVGDDKAKRENLIDLFEKDPITFAYQFGWAFSAIPAYIDPDTGFGVDTVGTLARQKYDEDYSALVDAPGDGKSLSDAIDIWRDFRISYKERREVRETYDRAFPLTEAQDRFEDVFQLFMRFMWQDPYNRAWVVSAASRERDLIPNNIPLPGADLELGFLNDSTGWQFHEVDKVWRQFILSSDVTIDEEGTVQAPAARRYIRNNTIVGNTAQNVLSGAFEDVGNWFDENIGQVIGLISSTVTGLVASVRLSLAQIGAATSLAGMMQQQANVLNAIFNDSRYYQAGSSGSLSRLVDNPFTREYGEPVIEIREPFQRVHYVSSFDSILDNQIKENLNEVATVITAVSDGKNPVTVHFDKGVPPERQVEKTIETGIYWDNVFGNGLFGMFQPLIHPLEALRGFEKVKVSSSDQLTARRIALYHLKKSLQGIYDGELLMLGNADIRPFDLVYIADVYERMYGFVEVNQVIHHFTPENGFVTSIAPNPIVTINDPAKWSMMSYIWSKMNNYNLRNDVRALMNVKADREMFTASKEISNTDVYKYFSTQMQGSMQYTQGNTALIRDIGAVASVGGISGIARRDEVWDKVAKLDIAVGSLKGGATAIGAITGAFIGTPIVGGAVGGTAGYVVGDLAWEAWQWVKDNLLDQHGCYIQYLTKDGEPMDAGLSYYKGVAAGTNHTIEMFPNIMGLNTRTHNLKEDGHYRITTNDLLGSIGWTEVDTMSLYRDTSLYVNQVNAQILEITGRDSLDVTNDNFITTRARILIPTGEEVDGFGEPQIGVIDGDTIKVELLDNELFSSGSVQTVRLAYVNTYELEFYNRGAINDIYDEAEALNPSNDLGLLAYQYLVNRFADPKNRFIVLRVDKKNVFDSTGAERVVATVFHNVPLNTPDSERLETLEKFAKRYPAIPFDAYLNDGRPYTLNWEMVMTGYGNVDMRESLWDTSWRDGAIDYGAGEQ